MIHLNDNLKRHIDDMKAIVEYAEIELSRDHTDFEKYEAINDIVNVTYQNIKQYFLIGEGPEWNGDSLRTTINFRYPGLFFRMDSVINALEDVFQAYEEYLDELYAEENDEE